MNFNFTKEVFFFKNIIQSFIMRTVLLLFCSTIFSFTPINVISQNAKIVIKENKKVTIDEIFDIIQTQTDYTFIYQSNMFKDFPKVALKKSTIKVNDLLSSAISNDEYHFELLKHNTIVIEKKVPKLIQELITGTVTDENKNPLVGVTVLIKGTRKGVVTDYDGDYVINTLKTNDILVFSSIGFETKEIKVGDKRKINVVLKESLNELGEIIISGKQQVNSGYQVLSKAKAIGAYSSVGAEVIESKFQTNILERLEGTVSGLSLYRGVPVIRGTSTLNGETYPLIILDGVPYEGDLESIHPNDIENVTVLKDATAASIYGVRSANGVIIVTTKRGVVGKPSVSYTVTYQMEPLPSRSYQNLMSSLEFIDYQVDVFNKTLTNTRLDSRIAMDKVNTLLFANADGLISDSELNSELNRLKGIDGYSQVEDELLNMKVTQQHNLSLRGGSETHQYALSLNYLSTGSHEKDRAVNQIGINIKNYFKFNDWFKLDVGVIGSQSSSDNNVGISGVSLLGASRKPYQVLRDEEGNPAEWNYLKSREEIDRLIGLGLIDQSYYPLNELNQQQQIRRSPSININVGAQFKLSKNLNLELRGQTEIGNSYVKNYYKEDSYQVRGMINDATQIVDGEIINNIPHGGQITETYSDRKSYTLRAQINYAKTFSKKHDVNVFLGGERRQAVSNSGGYTRYGYDDNNLTFSPIDEATLRERIRSTEAILGTYLIGSQPSYSNSDSRYISAYTSATYMYDDKLGLSASARIDESNLFGTNPKYRYRPLWSFGANYIVDTKSLSLPWLDKLKIRATYGISGNVYDASGPEVITAVSSTPNSVGETQAYIESPPNEELRWEQTNITNIGIDYELFSNRISGSIEFYNKSTKDAIGDVASDPILGWPNLPKNYASLNNKGIEFQIYSQNVNTEDFQWGSNFIFNYNVNKVTEVNDLIGTTAFRYLFFDQARKGQELNTIYSVRYAGLDEAGAPTVYLADGSIESSYSDLQLEDLIDEGTYDPPYHASLTNNITYKQFNLSFLLVYYGGHVQRDVAAGYYPTYKYPWELRNNLDKIHLNYWKQPGDEEDLYKSPAIIERGASGTKGIWSYANIHVQKADYIKMRNISLGYNVPKLALEKMNLSSLKLVLDIRNPFIWANNRNNLDPEVWSGSSSRGTPIMPTYTLGLNLNF